MKERSVTKEFEHLGQFYRITKNDLNLVRIEKFIKTGSWLWAYSKWHTIFLDHAIVLEDFYRFIVPSYDKPIKILHNEGKTN